MNDLVKFITTLKTHINTNFSLFETPDNIEFYRKM